MLSRKAVGVEPDVVGDVLLWSHIVAAPMPPAPGMPVPSPTVIQNKDGALMATLRYRGPDVAMMDYTQWCLYLEGWNRLLQKLGSGWALWADEWHEPARTYVEALPTNPAAFFVDSLRKTTYEQGDLDDTEQFLTLTWLPPSTTKQYWYDSLFVRRAHQRIQRQDAVQVSQYLGAMERIFDTLSHLLPHNEEEDAPCAWLSPKETATYLRRIVSWDRHTIGVPEGGQHLDRRLGTTRYRTGFTPMLGPRALRPITVRSWPNTLGMTIPSTLQQSGHPYRFTVRMIMLDQAEAKKQLNSHRRRWEVQVLPISVHVMDAWNGTKTQWDDPGAPVNEDARARVFELQKAISDLSNEDIGYCYCSPVITLWGDTAQELAQRERDVLRLLKVDELVLEPERENSDDAWQSTHVGNAYVNVRNPLVSTRVGAFLLPHGAIDTGQPYDRHWHGPALLVASTQGHPYWLTLHRRGERGNFIVLGPMRKGKSALMAIMGLQALIRYQEVQIFAWDRDFSLYCATTMAGGAHYNVGGSREQGFQPLGDLDSEDALRWRQEWLQDLFEAEDVPADLDERQAIWDALVHLAQQPRASRRMSLFARYLQVHRLKRALEPYCEGGRYACFDAAQDSFQFGAQWTTFEMAAMFELPAHVCALGLSYMFREMERCFDGRPTLLLLDEFWQFAKHPVFWPKILLYLKAKAKQNVCIGLSSQEVVDVRNTELWQALQASIDTWIFLPNEQAMNEDVLPQYRACGLADAHTQLLAMMQPYRDYLVKVGQHVRVMQNQLDPPQRCLSAASKPDEVRALQRLTTQTLTEPLPAAWLRQNGFDEVADIYAECLTQQAEKTP